MESSQGSMEIVFLDPKDLEVKLDDFQQVVLYDKKTGHIYENVDVKRMFPLTQKDGFLVILHEDNEIGTIRNYRELEEESRMIIEDTLEKRYFIPEILEVRKVTEEYRLAHWDVVTDRGRMKFYTRTRNDVVVKGKEVFVRDIDSNRYLIQDRTRLSPQSQKELSGEI